MLHESPPQQQHSCLSDLVAPFVAAPSFFIEHESPQQHSCLSDFVAPFDAAPSFFIEHESPRQHSCLSDLVAPFVSAPSFFIEHESLQQHDDMQQHDSDFLLGSVCVAVCANATLAIAMESPSTRPKQNL
jgi:hypothetical protein